MADLHLYIYDEVSEGLETYIQEEIKQVQNPENIYVHISSAGGGVYTGWTVGNIIANQKAKTVALIEGFCASIATYIALSCDEIEMAETAQFMIHNASLQAGGNKNDFEEYAKQLDKIDQDLISKYQRRTGLDRNTIAQMMDKETFLNTDETIQLGFADRKMNPLKAVAKFDFNMSNTEVKDELSGIKKLLNKVLGVDKPKNDAEPSNMALELEDGKKIFVQSEDGELEGKPVVMADEEGNPTEEPAPDGTHALIDGRSITVEGGVVQSVQEAENEADEEKEEMLKKIEDLESTISDLTNKLEAKDKDIEEEAKAHSETKAEISEIKNMVNMLSSATVGTPFKVDKPLTQPENKSVDKVETPVNKMDAYAKSLKRK